MRELKPNQTIMKPDGRLLAACEDLRYQVEHPNECADIVASISGVRANDPEAIQTVKVDGVEVGYKVKPSSPLEMNPYFDRYCYFKVPGHRLSDLSKKELAAIKTSLLEAFFEPQQGKIQVEVIGWDAMLIRQRFMVAFPMRMGNTTIQVPGVFNG
jgi:hypothetical protein